MAFFEFNIAMTGLFAAQRGLQVTSNNITNANTTGYSRQQVQQKASRPLSGIGVGMTGTGVDITGVNRVRDSYIDQKLWSQNPRLGEYNIKVTQNSVIEGAFGEPSKTGFTAVFNDLFNAISNLSKEPSSGDNKSIVRQEMINFSKYYNNISSTLSNSQQNLNFDFKNTVNAINALSTRISSLNDQIMNAEIYGDEASSFRDERDKCLDDLSKLIDIQVEENEYEVRGNTIIKMKVKAAGQVLVDHTHANSLEIKVRGEAERQIDEKVAELKKAYKDGIGDKDAILNELVNIDRNITVRKNSSGELVAVDFETKRGEKIEIFSATTLEVKSAGDGKLNPQDVEGLYDVVWASGLSFEMNDDNMSGELKGIIDVRDGAGTAPPPANSYCGIPYYIKRMDGYVQQFARTMNEEYSKDSDGYIQVENCAVGGNNATYITRDKHGYMTFYNASKQEIAKQVKDGDTLKLETYNPTSHTVTGVLTGKDMEQVCNSYSTKFAMFTYTTGDKSGESVKANELKDYSKMTAANFAISKEIYDNADDMRTIFDVDNLEQSDTSFMLNILAQKDNKDMFKEGDPKDFMTAIFAELGINAKEANMYQNTQNSVVKNLTNQRLSVSQVDISEEFTYLIKYQQAYQASAKIMTTIDGIYETTIFKLGNF